MSSGLSIKFPGFFDFWTWTGACVLSLDTSSISSNQSTLRAKEGGGESCTPAAPGQRYQGCEWWRQVRLAVEEHRKSQLPSSPPHTGTWRFPQTHIVPQRCMLGMEAELHAGRGGVAAAWLLMRKACQTLSAINLPWVGDENSGGTRWTYLELETRSQSLACREV